MKVGTGGGIYSSGWCRLVPCPSDEITHGFAIALAASGSTFPTMLPGTTFHDLLPR